VGTDMTKYETLLFDVDDTLLDFDLAENAALDRMFKEENIATTPEMIARYKGINETSTLNRCSKNICRRHIIMWMGLMKSLLN